MNDRGPGGTKRPTDRLRPLMVGSIPASPTDMVSPKARRDPRRRPDVVEHQVHWSPRRWSTSVSPDILARTSRPGTKPTSSQVKVQQKVIPGIAVMRDRKCRSERVLGESFGVRHRCNGAAMTGGPNHPDVTPGGPVVRFHHTPSGRAAAAMVLRQLEDQHHLAVKLKVSGGSIPPRPRCTLQIFRPGGIVRPNQARRTDHV